MCGLHCTRPSCRLSGFGHVTSSGGQRAETLVTHSELLARTLPRRDKLSSIFLVSATNRTGFPPARKRTGTMNLIAIVVFALTTARVAQGPASQLNDRGLAAAERRDYA